MGHPRTPHPALRNSTAEAALPPTLPVSSTPSSTSSLSGCRWEELPHGCPPPLTCRRYYRRLYFSGRLVTLYKRLFKHLQDQVAQPARPRQAGLFLLSLPQPASPPSRLPSRLGKLVPPCSSCNWRFIPSAVTVGNMTGVKSTTTSPYNSILLETKSQNRSHHGRHLEPGAIILSMPPTMSLSSSQSRGKGRPALNHPNTTTPTILV